MLVLPSLAAAISLAVALYAVYKGWRQKVVRFLVLTLLALSLEQAALCWRLLVNLPSQALVAQQAMQFLQIISLNLGLAFSFGYGQVYGGDRIRRQKWYLFLAFSAGLIIFFFPAGRIIAGLPFNAETGWIFELGARGQVFHVYILLLATLVLMNLEKLLRSSYGRMRWQLKFSTVGLGTFFALRIYQSGKALVFGTWEQELDGITAVGLILACICLVIALRRTTEGIDIYLSTDVLKNSVAAVVIGAYLLGVGMLVAAFRYFNLHGLVEQSFLIMALVFLVLLLISDRTRQSVRMFTARHFRRPSYDYRSLWRRFNLSISNVFDQDNISRDVVRIISENMQLVFAAIWVYDSRARSFRLSASSASLGEDWKNFSDKKLSKLLDKVDGLIDLNVSGPLFSLLDRMREETGCQGIIPLKGRGDLLGFMAFGHKVRQRSITLEERELLDMVAQQTGGALLNVSLFKQMAEVSEVEAFRNMSAFFLHDMKNLANQLSLTVENLPRYYDNQEFREDALRVLTESVSRIKRISSGMVLLRDEIKVDPAPADLNKFVRGVLAEMRAEVEGLVREDLHEVPPVMIDAEQMRKVVVNLLINARDAVEEAGRGSGSVDSPGAASDQGVDEKYASAPITVVTRQAEGLAVLEVIDLGAGMDDEFIRERLFQAFQTTKDQGMGVGLFQSRMIIEAHKGSIEVESETGKGTTFRVVIPPSS